MPGYCPPTLGKEVLKYRRVHVCMLIQEKYEHQLQTKHYGVTRIHDRHKHLTVSYDVSELIMNVLLDDATVVTAEQGEKYTAELQFGCSVASYLFPV